MSIIGDILRIFFLRSIEKKRQDILTKEDWEKLLSEDDIIVADKRKYRIETNEEHYLHAHPREQFDAAKEVIRTKYPDYMKGWFDVMAEVEKKVDLSKWPKPKQRWFIDELLLDVWLETKGYSYKEVNVDYFEKQNWPKKIDAFLKRKVSGVN